MNLGEPFDPFAYHQIILEECQRLGVQVLLNQPVASVVFPGKSRAQITLRDGGAIRARCVVDSTGNADIVAAAGVPFTMGRTQDQAVMPLTYCFIAGPVNVAQAARETPDAITHDTNGGVDYYFVKDQVWVTERIHRAQERGVWTIPRDNGAIASIPGNIRHVSVNLTRVFVKDPTDPAQLAAAEKEGKEQITQCLRFFREYLPGFQDVALVEVAREIGVRESRQVCGLYRLTKEDVLALRQFEDVIAQCCYGIDDHKPASNTWRMDYFRSGTHYDIPWRCLVPESGPPNLIVAGRSVSAEREAMASFRVQPSTMAIGEAAGVTAAMSAAEGVPVSSVSIQAVQTCLIQNGAILD
jgi:hypothetical protein